MRRGYDHLLSLIQFDFEGGSCEFGCLFRVYCLGRWEYHRLVHQFREGRLLFQNLLDWRGIQLLQRFLPLDPLTQCYVQTSTEVIVVEMRPSRLILKFFGIIPKVDPLVGIEVNILGRNLRLGW